jgi:hypothetical protein
VLLVNGKLGVANDVHEQDMRDLELDLFFDLGRHATVLLLRFLRSKRGDNFLEARIATQRVPVRMEFEKAIAEGVRHALHRRDLFDGPILLTSPGIDLRQINGQVRAVDSVFGDGQQFTAATSL